TSSSNRSPARCSARSSSWACSSCSFSDARKACSLSRAVQRRTDTMGNLRRLHSPKGWLLLAGAATVFLGLVPLLNAVLPASSPLHASSYFLLLLGKFACYAMVALAVDLVWGYTGILSLGHGVFFALGGYAIGMNLMLEIGDRGVYRSALPDFMVFLDWKELPWFWHGFDSFGFALAMAIVVPGVLAWVFGYLAFRSRIRGVYFSIITQALSYALMLLF